MLIMLLLVIRAAELYNACLVPGAQL
uniref:Uncharacterized protein n=1 Tax=Anguilla anguilla TaxID=7936 RepID=A0A0E9V5M6_ANGAN